MVSTGLFPTQEMYREAMLADAQLGGQVHGVVAIDPDINDVAAVRSLSSGSLFDSEKLSGAYGGHYVWVPRYSDSRRVEDRGFRVRYISVFDPPESGTYRLRFYGIGESPTIAAISPASTVQAACRSISADLADLEVRASSDDGQLIFYHQFRVSMGSTAGEILSNGGIGVVSVNRDFSQPLTAGERWCMSAKMPFDDEDEMAGSHTCIKLALSDILIPDLFPVTPDRAANARPHTFPLADLASFIRPEDIIGYYAPTNWLFQAVIVPPVSGSYSLMTTGWGGTNTTPMLLPYTAEGATIEAALREVPLWSGVTVSPQGPGSSFTIELRSMYAAWILEPSAGYVASSFNHRINEPLAVSIAPYYRGDAEASTLTDPGYTEGQTWFVHFKRRAISRVCPQTYPRKANGTLDRSQHPIPGTEWIDSLTGPSNDLDQCVPPVDQVAPLAIRYAYAALAAASPRGEAEPWTVAGRLQAAVAAGKVVYGPIQRRGSSIGPHSGTWALTGQKGVDFWWP